MSITAALCKNVRRKKEELALVAKAKDIASLPPYGGARRFLPQLPGLNNLVVDYLSSLCKNMLFYCYSCFFTLALAVKLQLLISYFMIYK